MTPRERALTREEILAEALALVDEQGLDALSMRKLAARLGVEAMSLYHHFPNKDAILDGLAASVLLGLRVPTEIPGGWEKAAEEACVEFRSALLAHPNVVPIMVTRPFNTEATMGFIEGPLAAVNASGVPSTTAGELYIALVAFTFGHALLSAQPRESLSGTRPDSPLEMRPEAYPAVMASAQAIWAFDEASFRRAVRAFIGGVIDGETDRERS